MKSKTQKLELGDFELGHIRAMHKGQAIAFVGTTRGLGLAIRDQAGFWPIPLSWFRCDSMGAAMTYADQLNEYALNITDAEAVSIVASTWKQSQT